MKNKFLKFITSMPFLVSASVVIPVGFSMLAFSINDSNHYENYSFEGYKIGNSGDKFELLGNKKLFRIASFSKQNNYQGGAFYQNYYFLAANNLESIVIYDMDNYMLSDVIYNADENPSYHCNNISFGTTFYASTDPYPLLYISMENADVHCTNVYRIISRGSGLAIQKVQSIIFPDAKSSGIYLPNSYIDHANNQIFYGGYTENTYEKKDTNSLLFYCLDLPIPPFKEMTNYEKEACSVVHLLTTGHFNYSFETSSQTATQGGFISEGYLYQSYGIHHPYFRVINMQNDVEDNQRIKEFSLEEQNDNFVIDEYENIGFYKGHIYGYGQKNMSIFEFDYKFNN